MKTDEKTCEGITEIGTPFGILGSGTGIPTPSAFWNRVDTSSPDGCWLWLGSKDQDGYGLVYLDGRHQRAHRVAFLLTNGYLPPVVMHDCDNPPCCQPLHLRAGTQAENIADCIAKGRHDSNRRVTLTHCPHGHEYTDENTRINRRGQRSCRTCDRIHRKELTQALAQLEATRCECGDLMAAHGPYGCEVSCEDDATVTCACRRTR